MKRIAGVFAVAMALALVLCAVGCSSGEPSVKQGLPDWANETEITEQVRELIELYVARDFEATAQQCEALGLTAEQYAEKGNLILDKLGAFKGYGDVAYLNGIENGTPYATVVQIADFENGSAQFTISVNEDGTFSGFYIK